MPGRLIHSPADVVRALLLKRGVTSGWGLTANFEPSTPDNQITVYDTAGVRHGRLQYGETQEHHGILVQVRSGTPPLAANKINQLKQDMELVYDEVVTIESNSYSIHSVNHASGPVLLGREDGTNRTLYSVNFLTYIRSL